MWEEDENDLAVFEFYKKLPHDERKDCEIFITPEKIYKIHEANLESISDLERKMEMMRRLPGTEIAQLLEEGSWGYYTVFKRVVAAIKEYYQLRPNIIEKYPEFLV